MRISNMRSTRILTSRGIFAFIRRNLEEMRLSNSIVFLGMSAAVLADDRKPMNEVLAKELLPKSYSISTGDGEVSFNYTPDLGGFSFHGLQLRVWMTANKAILRPGENLTLTVYYQNISEREIWVPDPINWMVRGYVDTESGVSSIHKDSFSPHGTPKKLEAWGRSSFDVKFESPIDEVGFLQINLKWGIKEEIAPNPITVECRKPERTEQGGGDKPATVQDSKSDENKKFKPEEQRNLPGS